MIQSTIDMILASLARGPLTGRDILERCKGRLSPGTVYVHLALMEDDHLVVSSKRDDGTCVYELPQGSPRG